MMTINVEITSPRPYRPDGSVRWLISVDEPAMNQVRYTFNPSELEDVGLIKALAAAFITAIDKAGEDPRLTALAKTNAEIACMLAVKSATHLDAPGSVILETPHD